MSGGEVGIGRGSGYWMEPGGAKCLRRRRRARDHRAGYSTELISLFWFLGEGDVTLKVIVVLSLVGSVLPLASTVSSSTGLSSSSATSSVIVPFKSFLEGWTGGLVVQLLLKRGVALGAFESAQLVGASSSLLTSSEVSCSGSLFPGDLDLPLDLVNVKIRNIVCLADHLGKMIHGRRELGEDDKTLEMFRNGTLSVGHMSEMS